MSKETAGELLPCPFCGSVEVHSRLEDHERWHEVICQSCGAVGGPSGDHEGEAITAWNRRAADRELRRGDASMPQVGVHAGEVTVLLSDAQAALAAKDAEIEQLRDLFNKSKDEYHAASTALAAQAVEIEGLTTERDTLADALGRLIQQMDEGPRGCYGRDSGGNEDWKGSFHDCIEKARAAIAKETTK